jgi:formylglycine-generating enzyme required for sulfatase activity
MNKKFLLTGLAALFAVQTFAQEPAVEMVTVQGGQFYMGNNYMENAALSDEAPEHKVTVKSFKMSKTEVPFDLFDLFCDATGWKKPKDASGRRGKIAVYNVSWEAAVMFCNWLSRCERLDQYYEIQRDSASFKVTCNESAKGYRLPTEAEWEFAARGGKDG